MACFTLPSQADTASFLLMPSAKKGMCLEGSKTTEHLHLLYLIGTLIQILVIPPLNSLRPPELLAVTLL